MNSIDDPIISKLQLVIHHSVKILAVLMTFVIVMGVVDACWVIYQKLVSAPILIFTATDMLATFGAFMTVLIAIEIFVNITIYLRDEMIHVKIVMATALMAMSRKVIVLDLKIVTPEQIYGIAAVIIALSIGYYLVRQLPGFRLFNDERAESNKPLSDLLSKKKDEIDVD